MNFRNVLFGALLGAGVMSAGTAMATTYDVDETQMLADVWSMDVSGLNGAFSDSFVFDLTDPTMIDVSALSLTTKSSRVNNFAVSLDGVDQTVTVDGSWAYVLDTDTLAAGTHTLTVTGQGNKANGGSYSVYLSAAPVPEPGEWALMLSGLGMLGYMARRRNKSAV
ncbi:PEP-CTERM sorting domain-containing protein [Parasulfuritortus cantonensis]|uniref:PEP-CTERM sorting domain-containing protein n=1 Tax=Parasulfuritortus cantonensis TaxID=2528202 RepID=A0A4R1BKV1_9PROT|nr:FxDxF family PEP-CTERM protein [Parasulfuritortus cantonensis]TCJ17927.1 PEP-CTERM sorting domain-containing protein [Parasulfuritortus cantonensis]